MQVTDRRAVPAVVVAVVLWATASLSVRAADTDALVFTTWRLWLALPPLAAIVWWRAHAGRSGPLRPSDITPLRWCRLVVGAGALFWAALVTTFAAFGLTTLLDVTLIGALQPVLIIAFAVAFLGERVGRGHLVRAGIAVTALALMNQCAETHTIARGLGIARPNARHVSVYRLCSSAFIGDPCPKNTAGISSAAMAARLRRRRRVRSLVLDVFELGTAHDTPE